MTLARNPELSNLFERIFREKSKSLHVAMPGQVVAYNVNDTPQTVDVRPCVDHTITVEDREKDETYPVILGVPLMFPGSGLYRLTFPIAVNDYVLLVFADRSTDEFLANGGVNVPMDLRIHNISDAFAIPGVTPTPNALANVSTSAMVLGKNGNPHKPAARKDDAVKASLTAGPTGTLLALFGLIAAGMTSAGGPLTVTNPSPPTALDLTGNITAGSSDVEIT
jgi:hypothetical protein